MINQKFEVFKTRTNLLFAFAFVLLPAVCFAVPVSILSLLDFVLIWFVFYALFVGLTTNYYQLFSNLKTFFKRNLFPKVVGLVLLFWIVLGVILNNFSSQESLFVIAYFFVFICFLRVKKAYFGKLFYTFLGVMLFSCILGLVDPAGNIFWFFEKAPNNMGFAIQFVNPNYSAMVVCVLEVMVIFKLGTQNLPKKTRIFLVACFVVFQTFLYANGSFAGIFVMIAFSLLFVVYFWAKNKQIPAKFVLLFLGLLPAMFLVDLFPAWVQMRTCQCNFFLESVAVFDNIFGTNLKGIFNLETVAGSDGWGRGELLSTSVESVFESAKTFLFGRGAGAYYDFRPHNHFLALWIDFGVVVPLCELALTCYLVHFVAKNKKEGMTGVLFGICAFYALGFFGSIVNVVYVFFVALLAVGINLAYDNS